MEALPSRAVDLPQSFQSMTMGRAVQSAMRRDPDKIAVVHGARQRSYRELATRCERLSRAAVSVLRLRRGDCVAIASDNSIEYLEIITGVPEAGVPVATINVRLSREEIVAICDDAGARVLFTDAGTSAKLAGARFRTVERLVEIGAAFEALLDAADPAASLPRVDEWDTWIVPYTSGTTGEPKGVMLSHRARLLNFFAKAAEFGCFSADDRFLSITPMNHGPGTAFPMNALVFGGAVEIMDRFDPAAVLRKLKSGGFTGIFTVPTHFHEFFALAPEVLEPYRHPPLKAIISNAAPLPPELKPRIVEYFGAGVLHELYSSTETSLVCNLRPADQLTRPRSVGLPFAHTLVKILDENGTECAVDEVGELFANSPYVFSGYWNRPTETAAAFRGEWVSVGDLARRDAQGYLYIVDRKKDMVISGGVNLYPREIELVLEQHPAIAEVAVVGVPDDKWGERLRAFVVLKPAASLQVEDLGRFCEGRLAPFKTPRDLVLLDALPRNANGKVLKKALRAVAATAGFGVHHHGDAGCGIDILNPWNP